MPNFTFKKSETTILSSKFSGGHLSLFKCGTTYMLWGALAMLALLVALPKIDAQTATITSLGASSGWYSDDTRNSSGTDLVGTTRTQYGKPGQPPTGADDIAIAQQLQFVGGPSGSTGGGTVKIIAPTNNSAKSTLSTVNLSGFAPASDLTGGSFTANYRWYMEPNPTNRTVAFRMGIQSTQWAASQASFTAVRSGEQTWDLILVHVMASATPNDWNVVNVDKDNGTWYLYGQAGNGNWVGIAGSAPPGSSMQKTLANWALDVTWGPILFGAGAKVTNVQFGLGSSQQQCNAYVDYLTTTILNSGNTINFAAPVRVYSDLAETMLVGGYETIQAAISDATTLNGYVVRVDPGMYNEKLSVNKSLHIRGTETTCILDGTGLGTGSGITITNGTTGVSISGLTVRNHAGAGTNTYAGIFAIGGNNNLTVEDCTIHDNVGGSGFYANGPVDNMTLNNLEVYGHIPYLGNPARGIVIWNGLKSNITITNCDVHHNNCCGIELQDGTATGVTMSNNNVYENGDNGIGIVGMQGPGSNVVSGNTLTNNGRFGMEIKNPNGSGANSGAGSIVVQNNMVTRTNPIGAEARDIAGIAVMRRSVLVGNMDVPTGVVVTGNTVSGYVQSSTSDGFGIVIGGTNHTVTGNTVSGNDVGIQQQAGHTPYPGDGNQNNLADQYFGRDNSPVACGNTISGNTFSSNGVDERNVGGPFGEGFVTNTNTGKTFCTIQAAISDAATLNGHIISVAPGTYAENITVNKSLDVRGPNYGVSPNTGTRGAEAIIVPGTSDPVNGNVVIISASNTFLNGFTIDGNNPDIGVDKDALRGVYVSTNGLNNVQVSNNIVKNLDGSGIRFQQATNFFATTGGATFSSNNIIDDNLIENITSLGVDLRQSMYTKVTNNVINNVRYGIYINSFRISDPGDPANRVISGNTIQSRQWGIWFNLYHAPHYETSDNTITAIADASRAKWFGIMLSTVSSPQNALSQLNLPLAPTPDKWSLINNSINGLNLDPATSGIGYWLWYVDNNRDNSSNDHYGIISGGSVSNVDIGLYMHNVDTDPSTNFGQGRTGAHASISNVNFSVNAGGTGIHLKDDPTWMTANIAPLVAKRNVNATINNCFVTGGADGVLLEESEDDKVSAPMNNNSITGQTGNAIIATTLNSTVDATCNWYGTAVYADLPAKIAGSVTYLPYLNSGTDDDLVTAGFQPAAGTCVDGPVRVYSDDTETTLLSTHVTIQAGVNAAVNGNVVRVDAGTYNEDVNINKSIAVKGSGMDISTVVGQIGGDGATMRVASPGVLIDGFTITRAGNNLIDWDNPNLNFAGVAIQGQGNDGEIRNCKIIGNRTGIDVNNSDGNNMHNNVITFNRTGLIFRNTTDNTILTENEVTDNWTVGVLFLDASSGSNSPVQSALNSLFNNNNISGNWYGQIVDRQSGGSLPAPGTTNMKNFECNWYGTIAPVVSTANSAEPGYSAQIPVAYGGAATPPGGQPDILGPASANFDYLLYLANGTDNAPATTGFQPVPLSCTGGCPGGGAVINTNTSTIYCSIQSAINAASPGDVLNVLAGTYAENVTVNKSLTLNGPNANATSCSGRVAEAIVSPAAGVPIIVTADDVTVNGLEVTAPSSVYGINFGNTSGVSIKSNRIHDIGTSVTNANVHAVLYSVTSASKSNASITDNCISSISSTALTGWSASAIGILQSASTGVLTGLNIERNTIDDVQVNTGNWPTGKIAYGITINVGGGGSYLTTSGEVVNAVIRDNEIYNVSGFIATGIGLEGNTKNALVENNSVDSLYGRKVDTRAGGGYDLSALKFENNRWVGTVTVQNNSFKTNTFTHDATDGRGYAISNYVPAGVAFTGGGGGTTGEATISCNWLGTTTYSVIQDNPSLDSKIFNKDNCVTNFVPYLVNGTDITPAVVGFQPDPLACYGGPVQVYNGNTFVSVHATIQDAIDAGTTVSGYTVRIASGTYTENVDAVTGGKNLRFAPGASPGCVTIVGDLTLNSGDILEIEIDGTTPCTEHDQFTVTGTVTLGGATITVPAGMYFAQPGDVIKVIDGASPIAGAFAQGNFVTSGVNNYYINYAGGDGNDVVLTKCCGGLLDLGIFNHDELTPAGKKLRVFVKPNMDVVNGAYSAGKFTIRTLTSNMVTFTNLGTLPHAYTQVDEKTDGGYTYYFFNYVDYFNTTVNWLKDQEIPLLTLSYDCSKAGVVFELTNDAFAIANNGAYYQELFLVSAQGTFYQATATSPVSVSITATSNSPVCETMNIDLNSTTSNGTSPYTYAWDGPNTYSSALGDPVPFVAVLASAGVYTVTVTDNNGCTASATTTVVVPASGACVKNVDLTTYYPTITQAINVPETVDGHTLEVPPGNWYEVVNVTKGLTIKGNNDGVDCDGSRMAESIINAGAATAVTISANGVTIDGFQIEGGTGVSSTGFTDAAIINNKVNTFALGIGATGVATTGSDGYGIDQNCIDLAAQAYEAFTFDNAPTLSASQAPGVWYTDRYAPKGFTNATFGGGIRLMHSIDATDCQSCRPGGFNTAFYNTQGRKYDITGAKAMTIQVYIPSDWATTGRRMAGFWGSATNGIAPAITAFPILEFTSDGSNPRFRGWNNGVWVDMGLPAGFAYDQWYTLGIAISGSNIIYTVGNLETVVPGLGSAQLANVILQGHNTDTPGVTYDIYWDNLNTFTSPAATFNTPTVGVALTVASGTQAVVVEDNNVSDAFYGYLLAGVTTTPRTTVRGGTYSNLLQGVAVVNTLDGVTYVPSTVGVADLSFTSFAGSHPLIPAANFHAGVYAFTGGANPAAVVDVLVDNVIVKKTGKTSQASAGLYFADFSAGAGNRLNAVVMNSEIDSNLNRGVQVRGINATALVHNNEIRYNGADPFGAGGNDGFGIIVNNGAALTLNNNTITNPPAQAGIYPVTAMFIGVTPAGSITAFENSINRNGNGSLTGNTYPIAQFTATCNWWQSASIDVVDGLVDGNVLFVPYLNNGTDTDAGARGFVPTPGSCVNPKRWYVNDNALTDDVFTLGLGDDLNQGTKRRPFRTIGKAVLTAVSADTVYADAGGYNEQVVVPSTKNNMHIIGVGPCNAVAPALTTMVDFTGTVSGKPTLFDIAGDGTVIDGIHFKVDLSKLNSAIIASHSALDNITVKNNCIDPYHSIANTYFGSYGNRNAISINYGGSTNYRVAAGGVNNIIVDNNRVTATVTPPYIGDADDIAFRSAVSVDEGAGTYTRNTFQSINHDVLVRFNNNGTVVIGGSVPNANTFLGGGVQYSDPNPGTGLVTVSHNSFDGTVVPGSVLRLQNNYTNAPVVVFKNTLSNVRWGMSLENFRNVTVDSNVLSPLAGFSNFRLITVNTKSISSNSASIVQVPINGVFTGNTFNAGAPGTGTAMAFYNHDSDNDMLNTSAFTVGIMSSPNVFAPGFLYAVYLGDQTGLTTDAPALALFPEYNLGAGSTTTMACWDLDINIEKNTFDVGSGAQYPQFMNHAQRLALEAILWHLPDSSCLGELIYYVPVELTAKVFLQGPYDSVTGLMKDDLRAASLVPSAEPYTAINTAFPTSFTKVNNFVTESGVAGSVFAVTGGDAIVDWVWLELRDKTNSSIVLATRSALVQRDGDIVDLDGTSAVLFPDSYVDEYFVMVRHRNHLGAMTASAIDLTGAHFVDFTVPVQPTFGATATSARKLIKTATYGLIAGNTIPKSGGNYEVKYNGSGNDRLPILAVLSGAPLAIVPNVYMLEDVNLDGSVKYNGSGNDRVIILGNVGLFDPLNVITQEPNF